MLYNVYFSRYNHRQTTQKWPHLEIKPSASRHYTFAMHNGRMSGTSVRAVVWIQRIVKKHSEGLQFG
jgi:hypothetical protein